MFVYFLFCSAAEVTRPVNVKEKKTDMRLGDKVISTGPNRTVLVSFAAVLIIYSSLLKPSCVTLLWLLRIRARFTSLYLNPGTDCKQEWSDFLIFITL